MRTNTITEELFNALLAAFRADPEAFKADPNFNMVAKATGATWRTAKKAWESGWPRKRFPAIKDVLEAEKEQARLQLRTDLAARARKEQLDHDDAVKQALRSREQEGQMVQLTRGQSMQTLTVAVELSSSARALAPILQDFIGSEGEKLVEWTAYERGVRAGRIDLDDKKARPKMARPAMTANDGLRMLSTIADLNEKIVHTARQAMEMERLHLGDPTNIIGIAATTREMTMDEAHARLAAANLAMAAMERNNGAMTMDAGIELPTVGELVDDI